VTALADTKISAAVDIATLVGTDRVPVARSASTTAYSATLDEVKAFTAPVPSTALPQMDGTASAGAALLFSRSDHVHPTDTSRLPRAGVTSGSNAAAGDVGEVLNSTILSGAAISVAISGSATNLLTLALTAGDWDVWGNAYVTPQGGAITYVALGIGAVSGANPNGQVGAATSSVVQATPAANFATGYTVPSCRISISATTNVYLTAIAAGATSATGYGALTARRAR